MSRYIDADKLHYIKVWISHGYDSEKSDVVVFAREIDKLAKRTTDVVEVVRCKDCKRHEWCSIEEMAMINDETFFCKYGERREDGETKI